MLNLLHTPPMQVIQSIKCWDEAEFAKTHPDSEHIVAPEWQESANRGLKLPASISFFSIASKSLLKIDESACDGGTDRAGREIKPLSFQSALKSWALNMGIMGGVAHEPALSRVGKLTCGVRTALSFRTESSAHFTSHAAPMTRRPHKQTLLLGDDNKKMMMILPRQRWHSSASSEVYSDHHDAMPFNSTSL